MEIAENVVRIVEHHLMCKVEDKDATLINGLNADSLDVLEIAAVIEQEYGIMIRDEELEMVKTVQDLINLVELKA
jgi:acyl carrier protein